MLKKTNERMSIEAILALSDEVCGPVFFLLISFYFNCWRITWKTKWRMCLNGIYSLRYDTEDSLFDCFSQCFLSFFLFFSSLWINDDDFRISIIFHFKYFSFGPSYVVRYSFHFRTFTDGFFDNFFFPFDIELVIVYLNNFSSFCFSFLLMDPMVVRDFVNDSMYLFISNLKSSSVFFLHQPDLSIIIRCYSEVESGISILIFDGIELLILNETQSPNDYYYLSIL